MAVFDPLGTYQQKRKRKRVPKERPAWKSLRDIYNKLSIIDFDIFFNFGGEEIIIKQYRQKSSWDPK